VSNLRKRESANELVSLFIAKRKLKKKKKIKKSKKKYQKKKSGRKVPARNSLIMMIMSELLIQ
jgi:hypothetical protein